MIIIYTPKTTNRIKYIFDFVFKQYFGIDYFFTNNQFDFLKSDFIKINYSNEVIDNVFSIPKEQILFEDNISAQKIFISKIGELPVLFPTDGKHTISFDIFSSIFYLITRYEEYLPHEQDEHGRYLSANSILSKPIFNFQPIVEKWLFYLQKQLLYQFPNINFKHHQFTKIITFDIDHAFQYKERNWFKHPPNFFKKEVRNVLFNNKKDHFDTFDFIFSFINQTQNETLLFFLLNDDGKMNSNVKPNSKKLHNIIQQCKSTAVGIHPSYYFSEEKFIKEKSLLQEVVYQNTSISRQHFLRIKFPTYFQILNKHHITQDYSLAYPNISGCRAGTTQPFFFFDLSKNETTQLLIQPFIFMDATYQYYQKENIESITQLVENLLNEIKKINGNFVSLFHNDLLDDNKIYKKLLYKIDEY